MSSFVKGRAVLELGQRAIRTLDLPGPADENLEGNAPSLPAFPAAPAPTVEEPWQSANDYAYLPMDRNTFHAQAADLARRRRELESQDQETNAWYASQQSDLRQKHRAQYSQPLTTDNLAKLQSAQQNEWAQLQDERGHRRQGLDQIAQSLNAQTRGLDSWRDRVLPDGPGPDRLTRARAEHDRLFGDPDPATLAQRLTEHRRETRDVAAPEFTPEDMALALDFAGAPESTLLARKAQRIGRDLTSPEDHARLQETLTGALSRHYEKVLPAAKTLSAQEGALLDAANQAHSAGDADALGRIKRDLTTHRQIQAAVKLGLGQPLGALTDGERRALEHPLPSGERPILTLPNGATVVSEPLRIITQKAVPNALPMSEPRATAYLGEQVEAEASQRASMASDAAPSAPEQKPPGKEPLSASSAALSDTPPADARTGTDKPKPGDPTQWPAGPDGRPDYDEINHFVTKLTGALGFTGAASAKAWTAVSDALAKRATESRQGQRLPSLEEAYEAARQALAEAARQDPSFWNADRQAIFEQLRGTALTSAGEGAEVNNPLTWVAQPELPAAPPVGAGAQAQAPQQPAPPAVANVPPTGTPPPAPALPAPPTGAPPATDVRAQIPLSPLPPAPHPAIPVLPSPPGAGPAHPRDPSPREGIAGVVGLVGDDATSRNEKSNDQVSPKPSPAPTRGDGWPLRKDGTPMGAVEALEWLGLQNEKRARKEEGERQLEEHMKVLQERALHMKIQDRLRELPVIEDSGEELRRQFDQLELHPYAPKSLAKVLEWASTEDGRFDLDPSDKAVADQVRQRMDDLVNTARAAGEAVDFVTENVPGLGTVLIMSGTSASGLHQYSGAEKGMQLASELPVGKLVKLGAGMFFLVRHGDELERLAESGLRIAEGASEKAGGKAVEAGKKAMKTAHDGEKALEAGADLARQLDPIKEALRQGKKLEPGQADVLRTEARQIWLSVTGYLASESQFHIHHRIPLEWAHRFPTMEPNTLSNLRGINPIVHDQITKAWAEWKKLLNGRMPSQKEILDQANVIDNQFGPGELLPHEFQTSW